MGSHSSSHSVIGLAQILNERIIEGYMVKRETFLIQYVTAILWKLIIGEREREMTWFSNSLHVEGG